MADNEDGSGGANEEDAAAVAVAIAAGGDGSVKLPAYYKAKGVWEDIPQTVRDESHALVPRLSNSKPSAAYRKRNRRKLRKERFDRGLKPRLFQTFANTPPENMLRVNDRFDSKQEVLLRMNEFFNRLGVVPGTSTSSTTRVVKYVMGNPGKTLVVSATRSSKTDSTWEIQQVNIFRTCRPKIRIGPNRFPEGAGEA